jgi:rhodanese-related sulfurtransferase
MIVRLVVIVVLAALLGGVNNLINPNKIDWVGNWPSSNNDSDSLWTSPSQEPGDPQPLRLSEAFDRFASKTYLFVDAREPEEYQSGHIKGSINLPFDSFDQYWAQVESKLPKDAKIVTYCSGTECDASLLLARLLAKKHGYKNLEIFFGGWMAWSKQRLPIEGKYDDELAN